MVSFWSWINKRTGYLADSNSLPPLLIMSIQAHNKGIWQALAVRASCIIHRPLKSPLLCESLRIAFCFKCSEDRPAPLLLVAPGDWRFCLGKPRCHPWNNMLRRSQLLKGRQVERFMLSKKDYILVISISTPWYYHHTSISNICHWITIWPTHKNAPRSASKMNREGQLC